MKRCFLTMRSSTRTNSSGEALWRAEWAALAGKCDPRRAWCAMGAGETACAVVSSFGRRTCCACVSTRRNRRGKNAGAGKTTTASESIAPPLSSSTVQWRAIPEKLRRCIWNRWTLIKRTQLGTRPLLPVRPGLKRVLLGPVVVCGAARALRAAGATITTLPPPGYWQARHAGCSGAPACGQGTTNTELLGRGRQPFAALVVRSATPVRHKRRAKTPATITLLRIRLRFHLFDRWRLLPNAADTRTTTRIRSLQP